MAITIRDLITDNGFEDGVTSITIKEGQVAFIKKKVPNTQWGWDYAQWNFNNSIISIRKVRTEAYGDWFNGGTLYTYEITGLKAGRTLISITDAWSGTIITELPVTVTP